MDGRSLQRDQPQITGVDLFCGAGGLTYGLREAGIDVVAGIDIDARARYAFHANNAPADFLEWDLESTPSERVAKLYGSANIRLLAGCAPCQPFSKYTNGQCAHRKWGLISDFSRYVRDLAPEVVMMENVPELATRGRSVFEEFLSTLEAHDYSVSWEIVDCARYGVPQHRKRLTLLASRLGPIALPKPTRAAKRPRTVRQVIGCLPPLAAGAMDGQDHLHVAARVSPLNLERLQATPHDGGSRSAWPKRLLPACYLRSSGARYTSIYGRLSWDKPAGTITTLCNGLGNGRFGHPVQDRALSLREAALLQSFPRRYDFWPRSEKPNTGAVARMIGNAVPPKLAAVLGAAVVSHVDLVTDQPVGLCTQ